MSFFESIKETITKRPLHLKSPLFYKSDSDADQQLDQLKKCLEHAPSEARSRIEQDIRLLQYGIAGEENVAFELSNSYLPIIVLHDLHIEYEGLSAQIDFLVITTKFRLFIECKNLYGNIEVSDKGEFIRTTEYNGIFKKEGIYSPITQNTRHMELIKKIKIDSMSNFLTKNLAEKWFYDVNKSVVVLANPKTVINYKKAPKGIKEQIIRCDQLNEHIKRMLRESKEEPKFEKDMYELAAFYMGLHSQNPVDYTQKYGVEIQIPVAPAVVESIAPVAPAVVESHVDEKVEGMPPIKIEETPIYIALKKYRYETSVAENVKAYVIYTNNQLEAVINAMPKDLTSLNGVSGFGDQKCQKYGQAIIEIVKQFGE